MSTTPVPNPLGTDHLTAYPSGTHVFEWGLCLQLYVQYVVDHCLCTCPFILYCILWMLNKLQVGLGIIIPKSFTRLSTSLDVVYPSGAPEFTPGFQWGSCYSIFSFMYMFCRSLIVILYFFFWPLCCLFFFDIRILITLLVSSNSSQVNHCLIIPNSSINVNTPQVWVSIQSV